MFIALSFVLNKAIGADSDNPANFHIHQKAHQKIGLD